MYSVVQILVIIKNDKHLHKYVTEFIKTDQIVTRTEIQIKAWYTHALFRSLNYVVIDSQVCFHRRFFVNPVKPCMLVRMHYTACGAIGEY